MAKTREEIREERNRLREHFGSLYRDASALLYRHDPVGINFEVNPDEYEPEVGTILPRLTGCQCAKDVQRVVHEEFQRWFANSAGAYENYDALSIELWELWQSYVRTT